MATCEYWPLYDSAALGQWFSDLTCIRIMCRVC